MPPARPAAGAGGRGVTTHTTNSFVRRGSTSAPAACRPAPGAPRLQTLFILIGEFRSPKAIPTLKHINQSVYVKGLIMHFTFLGTMASS